LDGFQAKLFAGHAGSVDTVKSKARFFFLIEITAKIEKST